MSPRQQVGQWSHHSILRSDETWLPEWSGNLGGVQRWRSSVGLGVLGQPGRPKVYRHGLMSWRPAKLLGFAENDIQILMAVGKLMPLGDPAPNAPKWFAAVEMIRLAADRDWLHKATKEISKYWRNKRERRQSPLPTSRPCSLGCE
jgi:hypothetical protein